MKFDLVDKVIEQDDQRIVTVKNVTAAEEYLADHFPGFPVLPGVMMLEAMVQAARRLLDPAQGPWVVAEVRNLRYGNLIRPGEQLQITVTRDRSHGDRHAFRGVGQVHGETAVQGRFTLRPLEHANDGS
jgi:3-hydroxyacyl-[acyl-carrier-protein] dehydratase